MNFMLFLNPNWHWTCDTLSGELLLSLGTADSIATGLLCKQLRDSPLASTETTHLTLEQAGVLTEWLETLQDYLSSNLAHQCAVRILAQQLFAAESVAKSHYFQPSYSAFSAEQGAIASLIGIDAALVLVFQTKGELADCLLLEPCQSLSHKQLPPLSHVRVLSNRLNAVCVEESLRLSA